MSLILQLDEIEIELERSVPYTVFLKPQCEGFEFIPPTIEMLSHLGKKSSFKIKPLTGAKLG